MPWTAEIVDFQIVNGANKITFVYTDGVNRVVEDMAVSPSSALGDIVRDRIADLERVSAFHAGLVKGPVTPSAARPAPTALELAQIDLKTALGEYETAARIASIDTAYDLTKYKEAVVTAQAAVNAASK